MGTAKSERKGPSKQQKELQDSEAPETLTVQNAQDFIEWLESGSPSAYEDIERLDKIMKEVQSKYEEATKAIRKRQRKEKVKMVLTSVGVVTAITAIGYSSHKVGAEAGKKLGDKIASKLDKS